MRQWLTCFTFFLLIIWAFQSMAGGEPWESLALEEVTKNAQNLGQKINKLESSLVGKQALSPSSDYWLRLSGQLNKACIYIEDGNHHEPHTIDNYTSPSVFRLESGRNFSKNSLLGTTIEADVSTHPSDQLRLREEEVGDRTLPIRKAEFFAEGVTWGRLSIGRGDTASYYTSVVDLSGTNFVINADVPLLLGSVRLQDDKALTFSPTVRALFGDFDGLRLADRLRYDFPDWRGLTPSASILARDAYDVALRYAREINNVKVAAATSYANQTSASIRTRKVVASGSVLLPNGISLTLASGRSNPSNRISGTMLYSKIGFSFNLCTNFVRAEGRCLATFFDGKTSFALDVNKVNDFNQKGDRLTAYGFAWVQDIPTVATELYVGWRLHELKSSNYPPAKDFRWLWGIMGGARVKL